MPAILSTAGSGGSVSADDVRLAELLAALSVATELARAMDLPERDVQDVYYCTLMQHLGCTAPAHETTYLFGDDLTVLPRAERTDERSTRESLELLALSGRGTRAQRIRYVARTIA